MRVHPWIERRRMQRFEKAMSRLPERGAGLHCGTLALANSLRNLGLSADAAIEAISSLDRDFKPNEVEEAVEKENLRKLPFAGYDISPAAIKLALRHAEKAGIRDYVHLQVRDVKELSSAKSFGCIVTNPPYGERLMNEKEVAELYKTFGNVCRDLDRWSINVITAAKSFEKSFGKKADKNRKFFNAQLECRFFQYKN